MAVDPRGEDLKNFLRDDRAAGPIGDFGELSE